MHTTRSKGGPPRAGRDEEGKEVVKRRHQGSTLGQISPLFLAVLICKVGKLAAGESAKRQWKMSKGSFELVGDLKSVFAQPSEDRVVPSDLAKAPTFIRCRFPQREPPPPLGVDIVFDNRTRQRGHLVPFTRNGIYER